jgi:hypothetical protein
MFKQSDKRYQVITLLSITGRESLTDILSASIFPKPGVSNRKPRRFATALFPVLPAYSRSLDSSSYNRVVESALAISSL